MVTKYAPPLMGRDDEFNVHTCTTIVGRYRLLGTRRVIQSYQRIRHIANNPDAQSKDAIWERPEENVFVGANVVRHQIARGADEQRIGGVPLLQPAGRQACHLLVDAQEGNTILGRRILRVVNKNPATGGGAGKARLAAIKKANGH